MDKHKQRLILGAMIGAAIGIMAAQMANKAITEAEAKGKKAHLKKNPTDWIKLSAAVVGILKQVASLFA